jgi:hypothetical protein
LYSSIICGSLLILILLLITGIADTENKAYAHFSGGATKNIDKYRIVFLLYPSKPIVGDNSTKLNFSVLDKDNNSDVYGLFTSLIIKDKTTGSIVEETPFKFHEFGDITFPYTFKNNTDYEVILQAKIGNDPKYENTPLTTSFDITSVSPGTSVHYDELLVYYVIPISTMVGIIGSFIIAIKLKRRSEANMKRQSDSEN